MLGGPVNYPNQQGYARPTHFMSTPAAPEQTNALVIAATPLLTFITHICHTVDHPNVPALKAQVIEEIKNLERKLSDLNYSARMIMAARYCICTAIDEAILSRPWGTNSMWVQEGLLSLFQKETYGGERFYMILEDMLRDIRNNIDFIELCYFLLSIGFEGKFYGPENAAAREEIRNRIFYNIRNNRSKPEKILSPHWQNANIPKSNIDRKRKLKKTGIISLIILASISFYFNYKTYKAAGPTLQRLAGVATLSPVTVLSQVIKRPIIMRDNND